MEIGGDGNSTQGSELSHMHTATDRKLLPGLRMVAHGAGPGSEFGDPAGCDGMVGTQLGRERQLLVDESINNAAGYLSKWILGAKSAHGLKSTSLAARTSRTFMRATPGPNYFAPPSTTMALRT